MKSRKKLLKAINIMRKRVGNKGLSNVQQLQQEAQSYLICLLEKLQLNFPNKSTKDPFSLKHEKQHIQLPCPTKRRLPSSNFALLILINLPLPYKSICL